VGERTILTSRKRTVSDDYMCTQRQKNSMLEYKNRDRGNKQQNERGKEAAVGGGENNFMGGGLFTSVRSGEISTILGYGGKR